MAEKIGIVTGHGNLSQKVLAAAKNLHGGYVHFVISPWLPLVTEPGRIALSLFRRLEGSIPLDPFHFLEIERALDAAQISSVFFTGDFPASRFLQVYIDQTWISLPNIVDKKCRDLLDRTPQGLSYPVRYFLALDQLLTEAKVKAVLANEIFPQFNVEAGCLSRAAPSPRLLAHLPGLIRDIVRKTSEHPVTRNRPAQATIAEIGFEGETTYFAEDSGTNNLLRRYARSPKGHGLPVLFKLPCIDFNPALDQPTIGQTTVEICKSVNVRGIVVCAETTVVVDEPITLRLINDFGMFLYAVPMSQLREIYAQHFSTAWPQNNSIGVTPQPAGFLP